ncbi:MAG TPA: hypothetical protein VFZ76_11265 [Anaerolineales bacterium]
MDIDQPPNITSFVIRFVHTDPPVEPASTSGYRGTIRHVQSNQEATFTHWQEAVDFINRFVLIAGNEV